MRARIGRVQEQGLVERETQQQELVEHETRQQELVARQQGLVERDGKN